MRAVGFLSLSLCVSSLSAAVRLADPFASGMVLQRDRPVPVWGTAEPGERVIVRFAGEAVQTTAQEDGAWKCRLPPLKMSKEPRTLTVESGASRQSVGDVLVGDVWFVSGQSNCEFQMCGDNPHFSDRNGAAIASITRLPLVRFCNQSAYRISATPKKRAALPVVWRKFSPENLMGNSSFSAMGVYFAIHVHQATGVPLGLVGAWWGGTCIDPWTPREGFASRADLKDLLDFPVSETWDGRQPAPCVAGKRHRYDQPTVLFNEMVNPWCPFAIKGMLWYQGCSNAREYPRYAAKMHALYDGWAQKFENPGLKLYFVQLAPWGFEDIAKMQEVQAAFEREEKNAGMVVINDLGNLRDIHPNEKGTVGLRLARMALKRDYGFRDIEECSPTLRAWQIAGDSFVLDFDHARRLYVYNADFSTVTPFEVAGKDGVFRPARIVNMICERHKRPGGVWHEFRGRIDGASRLVVKSDAVHRPVKLRYCHARPWLGTVYNEANLPLGAFHVDAPESVAAAGEGVGFQAAQPVWPGEKELELNGSVLFRAAFDAAGKPATLRVTGVSAYRIRLNGAFAGYGPARGPVGFHRVDEWPLKARAGTNVLEIEAAGYNCASYYLPKQAPFVQAEIVSEGRVLAATGTGKAFAAYPTDRVQKVARFSYQRCFAEAYRLGRPAPKPLQLQRQPPVALLPRIAPYPAFAPNRRVRVISRANATPNPTRKVRSPAYIQPEKPDPKRTQFLAKEFEVDIWNDAAKVDFTNRRPSAEGWPVRLAAGESVMLDATLNDCGFPVMTVDVAKPGKLIMTFDEILADGEVDLTRINCCDAIEWIFEKPGTYALEGFEPYVWRYANLFTRDADVTVRDFFVRTYKNSMVDRATFRAADPAYDRIFEAAKETFAQNAVDVFTDCPSRERAGWLCDSFFIGRVNRMLTGSAESERLFLQNYALPESFAHLPKGMVSMCYPADHLGGNFIPNWAMWLVIETEEYLARSGDRAMIDALKPRFEALVDYLHAFRNRDGLLEKLPKWVFVEWSRSNKLVQDVNYPSNMTWAEVLDVMNRLYGRPDLAAEAERVRAAVRRQSWTGSWFCDNAVRQKDGSLKLSGECTETCQYYAFFFKTATPETHPALWKTLVTDFGPKRVGAPGQPPKAHPEIWPSNAFIGNYLRLECLARAGLTANILDETKGFFSYMAERTGTLWEMISTTASCDHGFASHAAVTLYRDVLGVRKIDYAKKTVVIAPPEDIALPWCEGTIPVSPAEIIRVRWSKTAQGACDVKVALPAGWTRLAADDVSGKSLPR